MIRNARLKLLIILDKYHGNTRSIACSEAQNDVINQQRIVVKLVLHGTLDFGPFSTNFSKALSKNKIRFDPTKNYYFCLQFRF